LTPYKKGARVVGMAKYDIQKTARLRFARFGGLSSVNQRGYDPYATDFHAPPASRGFYAFVWPFYELFLLGAPETDDPKIPGSKFHYVRDGEGTIISDKHPKYETLIENWKCWSVESSEYAKYKKAHYPEDEPEDSDSPEWKNWKVKRDAFYEAWRKTGLPRSVLVEKPHPRIFTHTGQLWHHLGDFMHPGRILRRQNRWVKSDVDDYRDALRKVMHDGRKSTMSLRKEWSGDSEWAKTYFFPNAKSPFRNYYKCILEVFIEKIREERR
jgi:hypothetical protein